MTTVRKGQAAPALGRDAFHERFIQSVFDPAFDTEAEVAERDAIGHALCGRHHQEHH